MLAFLGLPSGSWGGGGREAEGLVKGQPVMERENDLGKQSGGWGEEEEMLPRNDQIKGR